MCNLSSEKVRLLIECGFYTRLYGIRNRNAHEIFWIYSTSAVKHNLNLIPTRGRTPFSSDDQCHPYRRKTKAIYWVCTFQSLKFEELNWLDSKEDSWTMGPRASADSKGEGERGKWHWVSHSSKWPPRRRGCACARVCTHVCVCVCVCVCV